MAKFHIKKNGEPGRCFADILDCPRGGQEEHYASRAEAREAFEKKMGHGAMSVTRRSRKKNRPLERSASVYQVQTIGMVTPIYNMAKKQEWMKMETGVPMRNEGAAGTLTAFSEIVSEGKLHGNLDEQAAQLRDAYERKVDNDEIVDSYYPTNRISNEGYLFGVVPNVHQAVAHLEKDLQGGETHWTTRINPGDAVDNLKTFGPLLAMDMTKRENREYALARLKARGWELEEDKESESGEDWNSEVLGRAIQRTQLAVSRGVRFNGFGFRRSAFDYEVTLFDE